MRLRTIVGYRRSDAELAIYLAVALVVTACGSTLPQADQQVAQFNGGGLGDLVGALPPGAHINKKGEVVDTHGEVLGTADEFGLSDAGTADPRSGSAAAVERRRDSAPAGVSGPGVTNSSMKLGLMTFENARAINETLGGSGAGEFDNTRGWRALVEYQNAHGGIAGRKIDPVFFAIDATSSETFAQQQQEQCAQWTQDESVFAGLTYVYSSTILECLHDAGAVLVSIETSNTRAVTPLHRKYPSYIAPISLAVDRAAAAMVDGLQRMKYFGSDSKLGVVTFDHPSFTYAADNGLMPALRRHGISVADIAYVHYPAGYSDFGQLSNDSANAALRFKAAGIDHVVFIDSGGNAALFFMLAAERQSFRPRYGLSSMSGGQALADFLQEDARGQLHGALSTGWYPAMDSRESEDPDRRNPTRALCLSIMRRAEIDTSSTDAKINALYQCDSLWTLDAAVDRGPPINQRSFLDGISGFRGSYRPGATWSTYLSSTQHDGVSSIANLRFVDECRCFKYLSQPYPIR